MLAALPAVAAIVAAIIAGRYAHRAHVAEASAARLRDLEIRIDERKYATYKPMLDLLRDMLSSANKAAGVKLPDQRTMLQQFAEFSAWVTVFGSDDAVKAFRNMKQASFHDPPAEIVLRITADFMVAARRDMGYSDTAITAEETLGLHLNDLYDQRGLYEMATLPFDQLAAKHGWAVPWSQVPQ